MKKVRSEKERVFVASTIGMMSSHPNLKGSTLIRCEYYEAFGEIELHAVNSHSLGRLKQIPTVLISKEEFSNRDYDYYNEQVEFFWAMNKLGCNNSNDED